MISQHPAVAVVVVVVVVVDDVVDVVVVVESLLPGVVKAGQKMLEL